MKITIRTKYLVFPVRKFAPGKCLRFLDGEQELYRLNISYDADAPDFFAHIDVSRYHGRTLTLDCPPDATLTFRESDSMELPELYREAFRPMVHFSTKNGWINDPNGLIYLDGEYHLFYQYNPAGIDWTNMHWGHAVSRDLLHWEERDIALFPDENGQRFSGCAIADERGLLTDGRTAAAVIYYTATDPFSQWMCITTDNFATLRPYGNAPVIPHFCHMERDPKVIFCDELDCYVMALFMNGHDYTMFRSEDMVHWERFFDYTLPGMEEFPDIMKFKNSRGEQIYVVTSNTDHYVVMAVRNGQFVILQDMKTLWHCSDNHSPVSFSGIPDGRCVRMIWVRFDADTFDTNFAGQLIALEYTLEEHDGEYFFAAKPLPELIQLCRSSVKRQALTITADPIILPMDDTAQLVKLDGVLSDDAVIEAEILGAHFVIDFPAGELVYPDSGKRCPLTVCGDRLDLTLLIDRCSVEAFADGGKSCMYGLIPKDGRTPSLSLRARSGSYTLDGLEAHSLESIWKY